MYDDLPQEMFMGNMEKKNGPFQDCNNGLPLNNVLKQKRFQQFKHCYSSDGFYSSSRPKPNVSGDGHDSKKRRMSDGSEYQIPNAPADYASIDFESNNYCLPLTQSFELMSHIPSILDDLKQELEAMNSEKPPSVLTIASPPSSPFQHKPVNFAQVYHESLQDNEVGSIKLEHLKLYNNLPSNDSKSVSATRVLKRVPNPISWENTLHSPSKVLRNPFLDNNSQVKLWSNEVKPYPKNTLISQEEQCILKPHIMSPKTRQKRGFFDSHYDFPAEASQNIDALIRMQQQITPNALPIQFEDLGGETITEDNLFDGCCEKELLIDLFKELTDDLKQANAEHTISITGFEDINMDEFTNLLCRSSTDVRHQEAGKRKNKATSSARILRQKLPSFTSAFC